MAAADWVAGRLGAVRTMASIASSPLFLLTRTMRRLGSQSSSIWENSQFDVLAHVSPGGEAAGRAPGGGGASAAPPGWRAGPGAGDLRRDVPLGSRHLARALQPRRRQGAAQRQRAAIHARPRDRGGGGGCGCGGAAGGRSRGSFVRRLPVGGLRTRRVRSLPRRGAAVQPVHVPQDATLLRWPIAVWRVREPRAGATLQVSHCAREGRAGGHPPGRGDGRAHSRRRSAGSRTSTCARA